MIASLRKLADPLLHLFFPHNCEGCGTDRVQGKHLLCAGCVHRLPATGFFSKTGNPIEKLFYGRCAVSHAGACYYFTKRSLVQHLLMELKYRGNREAGYFLGRMMGYAMQESGRFAGVDAIVPLPLNAAKEFRRGYNQAAVIASGITEVWHKPVLSHAVIRTRFTETQTRQNRISRWQNMERVFAVADESSLQNAHLLLVDDVVTTGATLEACTQVMLAVPGVRVSIAVTAYTV